jgi:phosphohistidine phosphatase SixA
VNRTGNHTQSGSPYVPCRHFYRSVRAVGCARPTNVPAVPIYLVRHGDAGSRARWAGDDNLRPLSGKGRRQAAWLSEQLAERPVCRLFSSPSRRCIETLEPLAARRGLTVEVVHLLDENGGAKEALKFLLTHAAENPVACSHGDVIPKVLRRLHAAGMRATDGNTAAKGSMWEIDIDADGDVRSGIYHQAG